MGILRIAIVLLAVMTLCSAQTAANAQVRKHRAAGAEPRRVWIAIPRGSCGPPDYNIVPRYCYDPRDDRVDTSPYAKPVAQVHGLEYGGPSGW